MKPSFPDPSYLFYDQFNINRLCNMPIHSRIHTLCDILGLIVERKAEVLDEEIEQLIAERQAARKAKNFARADEIRDQLQAQGIILEDTREGVKWKRA